MEVKKIKTLMLGIVVIILFGGCGKSKNIPVVKDTLDKPIIHEVYKFNEKATGDVLSIFNSNGDIKITKSDSENLKVAVNLMQTKNLKDINEKLNNLVIKPKIENGVIFYEPLCANDTTLNYWQWIRTNLNANGIGVNFEVQIPNTIKEVRVYNDIGNIDLQNVTAKIYAQTDVGLITGERINPLDSAVFKVNVAAKDKSGLDVIKSYASKELGINVKFASIDNANGISAGVQSGKISLTVPKDIGYEYTQVKLKDMHVGYPFEIGSKERFKYCREQSVQEFKTIKPKKDKTLVKIGTDKDGSEDVAIKGE